MAKKKKIVEEHKSEPVTNCDQSKEVVTNCDNQQFAVTIGDHKNIDIKSMIRVIRSQQVMLDFELAKLTEGLSPCEFITQQQTYSPY